MRSLLLILALTACATDAKDDGDGDTLGHGTLANVVWGGGLCQAGYFCAGGIQVGVSGFIASIADSNEVARGDLLQATRDQIDAFVAAIPLSEPTGVYMNDGGDGGRVELDIRRDGELRIYYTHGFSGDFGVYLADVRNAIGVCSTDVATYSSCTPQR
jgi:hypothetical protein